MSTEAPELTLVRMNKNNGDIEPRARGRRHPDWTYGYLNEKNEFVEGDPASNGKAKAKTNGAVIHEGASETKRKSERVVSVKKPKSIGSRAIHMDTVKIEKVNLNEVFDNEVRRKVNEFKQQIKLDLEGAIREVLEG